MIQTIPTETPVKPKRGGQPKNKNAKGNKGNKSAKGKIGNRGGKGAPEGNQFARKYKNLQDEMLREYSNYPEALAWIKEHAEQLRFIDASGDSRIDYNIRTPEMLAATGQEFENGFYYDPRKDEQCEMALAA